ncbi:T9SS type A sorting domain-containing protein [Flavobacterium sp. UBA7680]|uniref:T9SS type A sorting domain-containing protein n=1 Tax=Flavobacterium sp. UBA7680 TaxID=1946559 RepID=UPI0025C1353C|nr:T9SS type A sorting domain-containing protein [Flavobacterium sp. UBA7680]
MNKIKLSLVCAVLLSGISTYAIDGNEDFNLHVLKNGKMITFGLNQTQKAKLAIYDTDGTLLYSENASGKDGILRTFSLQEFPDGTYFLEVEDNAKKVRYEINVNNEIATLSSKAISSVYKTVSDKNTSVAVR